MVISQTRWLVSQVRLPPGAGISVFIDSVLPPLGVVLTFEAGVSHHTSSPTRGCWPLQQFLIILNIFYNQLIHTLDRE